MGNRACLSTVADAVKRHPSGEFDWIVRTNRMKFPELHCATQLPHRHGQNKLKRMIPSGLSREHPSAAVERPSGL